MVKIILKKYVVPILLLKSLLYSCSNEQSFSSRSTLKKKSKVADALPEALGDELVKEKFDFKASLERLSAALGFL